jgi:hypothetical protein
MAGKVPDAAEFIADIKRKMETERRKMEERKRQYKELKKQSGDIEAQMEKLGIKTSK